MLKRILFVGNYPNTVDKNLYVFFKNLICAIADQGVECYVISPVSVTKYRRKLSLIPKESEEITKKGNRVKVYYPRYVSASSRKIGPFRTAHITQHNYNRAVEKKIRKLNVPFDAAYGHFFLGGGLAVAHIGRCFKIPTFVAYGESSYETQVRNPYGEISRKEVEGISGIISVSNKNTKELYNAGVFEGIPVQTIENAVDLAKFNRITYSEAREKFNFPKNDFIVGFVGSFIERKGDKRILKACEGLEDVKLAFAGKGVDSPSGSNVIFCKSVNNEEIGDFLASLDAFCLPTLNEGCCNAVLEAMAAGKAIISSDLPFNDGVLTAENSIRVNPGNIEEIREAIVKLRDNVKLRTALSEQAKEDSKNFTIEKRANKILNFINGFVGV